MPIDSAVATAAFVERWKFFESVFQGGWTRAKGGGLAAFSGVAFPTLNGVWVEQVGADPEDIAELLDEVAATGLPHCLQFRPGGADRMESLAAGRGMARHEDIPLVVA